MKAEKALSSKPMTDKSAGIRSPASRAAEMAPSAISSLVAINAENGFPRDSSFRMARKPNSISPPPSMPETASAGSKPMPASASASR